MKILIWVSGILLLLLGITYYILFEWSYSKGSRVGTLVKLSEKGLLMKEWEGVLDQGTGKQITWSFSVHSDKLASSLMQQMGDIVKLEYKEHLVSFPYATKYEVYNWQAKEVDVNKLCPFLYLIKKDTAVLKKVIHLIEVERPDLKSDILECQKKLEAL